MSTLLMAGGLFWLAALLLSFLIIVWALEEPKPLAPVRLEDRSTWRRQPSAIARAWPHLVGLFGLSVALFAALSYAPR